MSYHDDDTRLTFVESSLFNDLYLNNSFPCSEIACDYIQAFYRIVDTRAEMLTHLADTFPDAAVRAALPKLAGMRFYRRHELIHHLQELLSRPLKKTVEQALVERLRYVDGFSDVKFLFGGCLWSTSVYMGYGVILYQRGEKLFISNFSEIDSCDLYLVNGTWNEKLTSWETLYDDLRLPPWECQDEVEDIGESDSYNPNLDQDAYHKGITERLAPLVKKHIVPEMFSRIWESAENS